MTGTYNPQEEETKTVTPDFQVVTRLVTPTSGKVLSQVNDTKKTLILLQKVLKNVTGHLECNRNVRIVGVVYRPDTLNFYRTQCK